MGFFVFTQTVGGGHDDASGWLATSSGRTVRAEAWLRGRLSRREVRFTYAGLASVKMSRRRNDLPGR